MLTISQKQVKSNFLTETNIAIGFVELPKTASIILLKISTQMAQIL
ncbi:MAG: hypothetical protein LBJ00_18570 [Planctomycetaceae bacterium]|jgi:hypothetical protein|nr:hypothetical protein [Planctomycetaceae bacterium]